MSDKAIAVIAETLREIDRRWNETRQPESAEDNGHAILAALKAARIAVVELPESVIDEMGAPTWAVEQHWNGQLINPGDVRIRRTDGKIFANSVDNPMDCPSDARSLAVALLAATEWEES